MKAIIDGREREWEKGDIVQVVNESHYWLGVLVVVDQPKSFGVQGYAIVLTNQEEPNGRAYIRLNHADIELVGKVVFDVE